MALSGKGVGSGRLEEGNWKLGCLGSALALGEGCLLVRVEGAGDGCRVRIMVTCHSPGDGGLR